MAPKLRQFAKRAVMLGCAALCLWCGRPPGGGLGQGPGGPGAALRRRAGGGGRPGRGVAQPQPHPPGGAGHPPRRRHRALPRERAAPAGRPHPRPRPGLGPGGGDPDPGGQPGGGLFRKGHHQLRHRPGERAGGALPGVSAGRRQRGGAHLPHPHQRGLQPGLHRVLLHGYGDPHRGPGPERGSGGGGDQKSIGGGGHRRGPRHHGERHPVQRLLFPLLGGAAEKPGGTPRYPGDHRRAPGLHDHGGGDEIQAHRRHQREEGRPDHVSGGVRRRRQLGGTSPTGGRTCGSSCGCSRPPPGCTRTWCGP